MSAPERDRAVLLQVCGACGETVLAARGLCPACGTPDPTPTPDSGRGRVVAATTVHRAAGESPIGPAPFDLALVALDTPCADKLMALSRRPLPLGTRVRVRRLTASCGAPYLAEPD
jgi:uncharacterized OB-fold protein